ncbi:histidine kinase [Leptospira sp. 2 VSF19]|uniref:Histidine kinase n=1 Tax=Leptospira soteropolitanensis TaxID=2950025 RepID=A0AAW5VC21_9LEPT|nr:histidine kinase [Leptospira soteropolitanensis]MCW7492418.1 histidine kinase [Leptospira soteropolitanensis]MCW7500469.1 histidine kinase [Leptospira soteropolitanensis]MCW7522861.1 histidine kinase [Leptospira soteropolitanensis]MCW7526720.1 histidine kinase [Leptospira soteropolitanensis]MCW7530439.1 histidine kinase [Leptospira soteropolitanensis]
MLQRLFRFFRGIPLEPISLLAVYSEIISKLYFLGFAYCLAYIQSVYLEWNALDQTNCLLSAVQLVLSIILVLTSFFYRRFFGVAPIIVRLTFFLLVLVEIETGFHDPTIPYFDPRNWLTITALLATSSFFYPGLVWQYILEWSIVLFLYVLRVYFTNHTVIPIETWREMSTIFPLFLVAFYLNHWWFRTRYIAAYRGMLLEEKRRTFFQDIHDSLGSQLTDLVLLAQKMEKFPDEITGNQIQKIKQLSESALQSLRTQVQEENQRELFQESLLDGLKLSMKKRYKLAGRGINLEWMSLGEDPIIKIKDPEMAHHILQIFKEITTNDLRHGEGISTWKLEKTPEHIEFQFFAGFGQSQTNRNSNQEPRSNQNYLPEFGIGEQGLYQRIKSLNGFIKITDSPYHIDIKLPMSLFHI